MGKNLAFFGADEIRNFYLQISTNVRKLRENKGISQLDMALSMDIKIGRILFKLRESPL